MSILAKFLEYSKNPTIETNYVVKNKFWEILKLLSVLLMMLIPYGFLIEFITGSFGFEVNNYFVKHLLSTQSSIFVFFLVCIQAPILEEIEFRLVLRPNIRNVVVSFWLLVNELIFFNLFQAFEFSYLIPIIFSVINFVVLCYWILEQDRKKIKSVLPSKYYKWLYYFTIFYFAFGHFANFTDNSKLFLLPILVLPHFIIGLGFSFVRMNFGLRWSIFMHFLNNFIAIIPILICKEAAIEIYESISESKQIIPDLVYTLPATNQFFYLTGVAISVIFILFGIYISFLTIKEYLQYKKTQSYVE